MNIRPFSRQKPYVYTYGPYVELPDRLHPVHDRLNLLHDRNCFIPRRCHHGPLSTKEEDDKRKEVSPIRPMNHEQNIIQFQHQGRLYKMYKNHRQNINPIDNSFEVVIPNISSKVSDGFE